MYYLLVTRSTTEESRYEFCLATEAMLQQRVGERDTQNNLQFGLGQWADEEPFALQLLSPAQNKLLDVLVKIDELSIGGIRIMAILRDLIGRGYRHGESFEAAMAEVSKMMTSRSYAGAVDLLRVIEALAPEQIHANALLALLVEMAKDAAFTHQASKACSRPTC